METDVVKKMGTRGRISSAEIAVIGPRGVETIRRPEPPRDLTDEQAHEWRSIVNRLSADWFPRETHGLLAQYCRHVVTARRISEMIAAAEVANPFDLSLYDKLLAMQEREGRAISSLATRMRISQQATVRHEQARKPTSLKAPWKAAEEA